MSKKRKTREQKIILRLRRELAQGTKLKPRQEANSFGPKRKIPEKLPLKKQDDLALFFDPKLIKKDILKTLILSLTIISLEVVLYLRLR